MKVYKYHRETKELWRVSEALLDPLEGKPLCPASATFKEPGELLEGHIKCFIDDEWVDVEDHRSKKLFNIYTKESEKCGLGPIPNHLTDKVPKFFDEWDSESKEWKGHEERKKEWDLKKYARDRKVEYPDIGDQLDALYHAGLFPKEMADKLKAVKEKNPKPVVEEPKSELKDGN